MNLSCLTLLYLKRKLSVRSAFLPTSMYNRPRRARKHLLDEAVLLRAPNGQRQARGAVTRTFELARRKPRRLHAGLGRALCLRDSLLALVWFCVFCQPAVSMQNYFDLL
jgi:hypothetical protein